MVEYNNFNCQCPHNKLFNSTGVCLPICELNVLHGDTT